MFLQQVDIARRNPRRVFRDLAREAEYGFFRLGYGVAELVFLHLQDLCSAEEFKQRLAMCE